MKLITVQDLALIVKQHGFDNFLTDLIQYLKDDFVRWAEFDKSPRYAAHVPGGVLELMPTADKQYFAYKCVNGHPANPFEGKQTVVATGQLNEIKYGYPLLISEMTTLTGLRTAATSAMASAYLSRTDSSVLALIGTGAQSEFQARALRLVRPIKTIRYFDTDPAAMDKFERNMNGLGFELIRCNSAQEACEGVDIITVCTACKNHVVVIENSWVKAGMHINGLGGDCPGKTELDKDILFRGKVVVEYTEQSMIEGDIQQLSIEEVEKVLHAELWEIIKGDQTGRETAEEVTIFDGVGFAVEDFSVLRLTHDLAHKYGIGHDVDMVPPISDPKNLISVLG
jgi:ornithine cyclodeaminase